MIKVKIILKKMRVVILTLMGLLTFSSCHHKDLEQEVENLKQELAEKESQIEELESEVSDKESKISDLERKLRWCE